MTLARSERQDRSAQRRPEPEHWNRSLHFRPYA